MDGQETRAFAGQWITTREFENRRPVNVFHRQLQPAPEAKSDIENRHILFRRKFSYTGAGRATLFITADDYYKLYLNGRFVTQGPCPGYPWHYYYNVVDVTPYLTQGENVIAVHTYYQGLINRVWVSGDDRHGLLLDLTAGGKTVLASDASFLCAPHTGFAAMGKSGYDTQFMERYDSGAPEVGFEKPEYDDGAWERAVTKKNTDYRLFCQPTGQLAFERIRPVSVKKTKGGYLADFGKEYVGYLALRARGSAGDTVTILCGQELCDDGSVRFELRSNCRYREEWVLSGGEDTLDQFDYKSFRYAELLVPEGCEIDTESWALTARHYPFSLKARCNTDDPTLGRVWALCVNTIRYGVQEVIQDCMDREKGQYLGDGCYTSLTHALLTKDTAMMEKLIDDSLRSAPIDRGLMTCTTCSFMQEIADYSLMLPMLMRAHYQLTKDKEFLRARFPALCDVILAFREAYATESGMIANLDKWCVVEWPDNARDGYDFDLTEGKVSVGMHNAINALYVGAVKAVGKLADLLGEAHPIAESPLEEAYRRTFYDEKQGLFADSPVSTHCSLASNAYPLALGLCPDRETELRIVRMIGEKRLSASMFFVTFAMLAGLCRAGRRDLCLSLIADEGGWLRMLREGATTTFEGWGKDSKWNTSLFHLTFTYPVIFLTDWGLETLLD